MESENRDSRPSTNQFFLRDAFSPHSQYRKQSSGIQPQSTSRMPSRQLFIKTYSPENEYNLNSRNFRTNSIKRNEKEKEQSCIYPFDKENLNDQLMKIKKANNQLTKENHQLRTKCLSLEQEILRYAKNSKTLESCENCQNDNVSIIIDLKNQIKNLKQDLEYKDEYIQQLKMKAKIQKYQELEIELQSFQNESQRLKNMLQQAFNLQMTEDTAEIREDNIKMASIIKEQATKINELQAQLKDYEIKALKFQLEKGQMKKQISSLAKDVDELKIKDPYLLFKKKGNIKLLEELKSELDKKILECNNLSQAVMIKDRRIFDLNKKNKELTTELENFHEKEKEQSRVLYQEELSAQKHTTQLSSTFKRQIILKYVLVRRTNQVHASQILQLMNKKSETEKSQRDTRQSFKMISEHQEDKDEMYSSDSSQTPEKLLPRVEKEDVKQIGIELKFKFRQLKINLKELEKVIGN